MISTLGPRLNSVFRSRWRAIWWSAGVLLTAYCSVPAFTDKGDSDATATAQSKPDDPNAKDAAELARILGDGTKPKPTAPANPWAKSTPQPVHIKGE